MIGNADFIGYFAHQVFIADVLRAFCLVGGAIELGLLFRLARIVRNTRQWGIYALICSLASVVITEFNWLGYIPTVRLLFNCGAVVFAFVYLKRMNYHIEAERTKGRRDAEAQKALHERQLDKGIHLSLPEGEDEDIR